MSLVMSVRQRTTVQSRRTRSVLFGVVVAAGVVAGAFLASAEPTGLGWADGFWRGAAVGVAAFFAATARRWTWFLPAGVGAALAADGPTLAFAGAAIAIGLWSVATDTRSRARGALVGGLGCLALLGMQPVAFNGLTVLLGAAALIPLSLSGYAHAGRRMQAKVRRVAVASSVVAGLMLAGALIGVVSVQRDLAKGVDAIDGGLAAARDADDDVAAERLGTAARHLGSADATLSSWFVSPARSLPVIGPNLSAVGSLSRRAGDVAEVSSMAAVDADVDALRFLDGRLDPKAVADLQDPLDEIVGALRSMDESVASARSSWLVPQVADRMDDLEDRVDDAMPDARIASGMVSIGPDMLGANGPRRYLVLFVTPVEARGRFGFPGNFAEVVLDDGRMTMPRFGRISELEQGGTPGPDRSLSAPADYVARYERFDVASTWRNLTMSPDFPSVALAARDLYPQSGGRPLDGVVSIDPAGLEALMRFTGPVTVDGFELNEENTAQFLMVDQYLTYSDQAARVDMLEEVARTTFERLTSVDLPGPRAVSEVFDPVVDGGHLQIVPFDTTQLVSLLTLGMTGDMSELSGDGFAVTTSNAGGSKIDVFLGKETRYEAAWDPATGEVRATLRTTLTNDAPSDGLPDYLIGNSVGQPPGTNRSFVSFYSPFELDQARLDGQPLALQSERELDRNVYSTMLDIPPGGSRTVELDLTGSIEGPRYDLDLDQQVMAGDPEQVEVALEVAGDDVLTGEGFDIDGRTARWAGPLAEQKHLSVAATSSD